MDLNIESTHLLATALVCMVLGYVFFILMRRSLPKRLKAEQLQQREIVRQKAITKSQHIAAEARSRQQEKEQMLLEEFEAHIEDRKHDLEAEKEEILLQEQFVEREEQRLAKVESQYQSYEAKVNKVKDAYNNLALKIDESRHELHHKLAAVANCTVEQVQENLRDKMINTRTLDSQKRIKELTEQMQNNSKKSAERTLSRLLARYEPQFVWPKPVSHVEITSSRILDALNSDQVSLIADLTALTDQVEIGLSDEKVESVAAIKLGGGYGIDKEAARLTLEELLPRGSSQWNRVEKVFQKHRQTIEAQAQKLGHKAVNELRLEGIHPEIQKMVGALNWRTSYRQNQYHHSLEVAKLAGILAFELGVDPQIAKRCGLLHDIGKGIDYRIEGSHAVISGDYADRYGEHKIVCDTVMSHHNDLILETPMSYVLKSADTLSGARPGARVNLEEGYQIRLSAIEDAVKSFPGILKIAIMNGGREVHIEVNHKKVKENELKSFTENIAQKIEEDVAYPGQIKVLVSRRFESVAVA